MNYSKQCKNTWIETDIAVLSSTIELAIDSRLLTMNEFTYTVCNICPYLCDTSIFCWSCFLKTRNENSALCYINIMKVLIEAFYNDSRVNTFNFFRTKICKACDRGCKNIYLGSVCTEKYLRQMEDRQPLNYTSGYKPLCTIPKKKVFPAVYFDGDNISEIINKLWKPNNEITSEERINTAEN